MNIIAIFKNKIFYDDDNIAIRNDGIWYTKNGRKYRKNYQEDFEHQYKMYLRKEKLNNIFKEDE